jgi:RNA binding exosome subunit
VVRVLSSKIPIGYVEIRALAHATEDLDKVLTAARNVLPAESRDNVVFKRANLTGHHGNPITVIDARITDRKVAQAVLERLSSGLAIMDKEQLGGEIGQHVESGNLYIRLDKQSAYFNETKLGSADPIRLRVHFRNRTAGEVVEACRRFGLLP